MPAALPIRPHAHALRRLLAACLLGAGLAGCVAPPQTGAPPDAPEAATAPRTGTGAGRTPPPPALTAPPAAAAPQAPTTPTTPAPAEAATAPDGVLLGRGLASWYGPRFHGRRTASGERFDRGELTAAHRTLPFGARVCVRSLVNGKAVVVRVNDRGPYAAGRVIDLSEAAAQELGMMGLGIKPVEIWHLGSQEDDCPDRLIAADDENLADGLRAAQAPRPAARKGRAAAKARRR